MFLLAQLVGLIGLIFTIISFFEQKKDKILLTQLSANISYAFQLYLLKADGGMYLCLLAAIRTLYFYKSKSSTKKQLFIFCLLSIIIGFINFKNVNSIIPVVGFISLTYALWQNDVKKFRKYALINSLSWLVYDFLVGAYTGSFSAIIEIMSIIFAISKLKEEVNANEKA